MTAGAKVAVLAAGEEGEHSLLQIEGKSPRPEHHERESEGIERRVLRRGTDFPIRDHKVILKVRRRRWLNRQTGESFVDRISVTEKGTRYSKEFAAFLKETYGHIPSELPYT